MAVPIGHMSVQNMRPCSNEYTAINIRDNIPAIMPVATPMPRFIHVASTADGFTIETMLRIMFHGSSIYGTVNTPANMHIT